MNPHDVTVVDVALEFSIAQPAGEFAFGAAVAGALTLTYVRARVKGADGRTADGYGAILLSHPWAFPTAEVSGEVKDGAMRALVEAFGREIVEHGPTGHPLDIFRWIEPRLAGLAESVAGEMQLPLPIPPLASLVSLSPIDAAIHDAYARLHGCTPYGVLGPEHLAWDLSDVLGEEFTGMYPRDVLRDTPVDRLPIYHTVGATDPLSDDDPAGSIKPLAAWIRDDGLFAFKVKLKGKDLEHDLDRLRRVHAIARDVRGEDRVIRIFGDLNEQAPDHAYIEGLLAGLKSSDPDAFAALEMLEQPDRRDMAEAAIDVHDVARQVPIALDEGWVSPAAIDRAVELGYNAIALKTCKTQSLMLLAIAKARSLGLTVSVQDLTNTGIALIQSLSLAARLLETMPIETNQRQYFPSTSDPERSAYPHLFAVRDGHIDLSELTGPGFGFDPERIDRDFFHPDGVPTS